MEWKEVTLGDFMQCNPKRTIKKGQKARKITMDLLIPHSKTIRNWNYEPYSGGAKFQNGDTIMARITPCLENGKHAFVSILNKGEIAYGSTEYFVFCGKEDVSDNDFVYYLTKTPLFRDTAIKSMVGSSGRQRAQIDVLENLKMLVPKDISDQRRIASILSSLDRKIELNNKINADLEEMAQAIFKNWFVDFEPFKNGKFVDSELGMIPEGWKVGTLEDIAEITMGQSPAGNSLNENGEGMIFYQGSSDFGFRFPSIRVFTTEPKRLAVANSVLFSVRAPVGDINVAKEECCIGRGVASIKSKYGHDSYLFYAMKSLHKLFDSFDGEGTVFGSINKKTLSAIQILLPSDGIVEQFNNVASSFDDRIRSLSEENSRLSLLRDTLLPRLMSGELEVPE
ncbi:MAG: restriction endonuclease subunit S [Segatella copri]|nr:restriction endonuclease subunit S [Segatella copri]